MVTVVDKALDYLCLYVRCHHPEDQRNQNGINDGSISGLVMLPAGHWLQINVRRKPRKGDLMTRVDTVGHPSASAGFAVPTTKVLAIGRLTGRGTSDARGPIMPSEVRETVRLYLGGKIDQWHFRPDGSGVVFIMNLKDLAVKDALTRFRLHERGDARIKVPIFHRAQVFAVHLFDSRF